LLVGTLSQLVHQSLEIFETKKGEAKPVRVALIKHTIRNFHMDENGSGWESIEEPFERLDWSTFIFDLMQKYITVLPVFHEIVDTIIKEYEAVFQHISPDVNKKSQTEFWLGNFVRAVLYEKLENKLTDPRIIELITIFEHELNGSPLENKIASYVTGLYPKTDSILLDDSTTIRKLRADDLEYEYYAFIPFLMRRLEMRHPSAVIEVKMRVKDESELWKKLERVMIILRLFRLGSVHPLWNNLTKVSVIWPAGTSSSWSHSGFSDLPKYTIQETETDAFRKFFETLEPLVKSDRPEENVGFSIAITRYNNALLDPVDTERKLMTAMMALESLYSLPSDKGEIGYKISIRSAKLLSFLGFKPTDVRKNVEKSYYVRSRVAHGLVVDEKKVGKIGDLLNTLLEYVRLSLIIFILIGPSQKNRFVSEIDNSLIDATSSLGIKNQMIKIAEQIPSFSVTS
jgi:hypothetical protein